MELNRGNFIRLTGIIFMSILLYVGLQHFNDVSNALRIFLGILSPFILGGGLAFVLNVPMRAIENVMKKIFSRKKKPLPAFFFRIAALLLTLILFTGLITAVLFLIVPELIHTTSLLIDKYPDFVERVQKLAELLSASGIEGRSSPRIRDPLWMKIVANLTTNPLSVVTGDSKIQKFNAPPSQELAYFTPS